MHVYLLPLRHERTVGENFVEIYNDVIHPLWVANIATRARIPNAMLEG